ncbi:hypothetical protein BZA70DRAFT_265405 [Myxozyma melibiosi]|uniref:Uncharacterized protein n=1 Tax=Myxozyma melibiosi TaxID=54550 RepID=A0ABR1FFQ8_9ASCO
MSSGGHKQSLSGGNGSSTPTGRPAPSPLQRSATSISASSFSTNSSSSNNISLSSLHNAPPMFQSISKKIPDRRGMDANGGPSSPSKSPSFGRTEILAVPTMSFKSQRGQPVNSPPTNVGFSQTSNSADDFSARLKQSRTMPVLSGSQGSVPQISNMGGLKPTNDDDDDSDFSSDEGETVSATRNGDSSAEKPTTQSYFSFLSSAKTAQEVSGIEETLEFFSWTDRESSRGLEKQIIKELQQVELGAVHTMIEPDLRRGSRLLEALDRGINECLDLEKKLGVYKTQLKSLEDDLSAIDLGVKSTKNTKASPTRPYKVSSLIDP